MELIQEKHGFRASPRKWKMKFKEWGYEKRLTECNMKIVAAKAERRAYEDGKKTEFFHNGIFIQPSRIENFKRRKTFKNSEGASPSAETPLCITYCTPRSESSPGPESIQDTAKFVDTPDVIEAGNNGLGSRKSSSSTSSIRERLQVDGSTASTLENRVSNQSASSILSPDSGLNTTITVGNRFGKETLRKAPNPPLNNFDSSLRIKSLQRVYSPLLFRRPNELLHRNQQPDGRAIMLTQTKAEFHVRRHEYDEAAVLYWKVIAGWRFLGNDEKRLEAQLTLGGVFEKQDRVADAFSLFMSSFIEYLDIALSLTLDSPQFISLRSSAMYLRKAHIRANIFGKWSEVSDRLGYLDEAETESLLSHHEYPGPTPGFIHGPDVVKAAINLAIAYSAVGEFGIAESIFKLVLSSTSESSRKRFNTLTFEDRAIANRDYAMHCHQRGNNLDCFSYLARALENCLEAHFPGIGTEITNSIKHLLKMMNRQLVVDKESAAELAELKLQQVSVVISIISKTVSYKESCRDPSSITY
ncbi:hypothetical protein ONS95_002944 [Cadophora gregata]|uniref:uncharacterized protein n=1 Tax=Cadophora gregata TaxID=51156 RepID=UPI0026DC61E8|nr:uncharacterized protein ONS95_002944 [Cadophora gregata]KAK0108121.1 hypothetical protein ONS95_002944 [Cadophora gregata]KAK0109287.1 hypothetical protein ONS96_003107 [Cadophora gregata f. sp. sojae]